MHLPASGASRSVPVTADLGADVSDVSCTVAGPSAVSVTPCGASMTLDLTGAWDGIYTVTVTVTDSQGNTVPYYVVFVEQAYRGTSMVQIKAYLDRFQPQQWPSDGT